MKEFELSFLDIDRNVVEEKLRGLGAEEFPEYLMRRWVFNIGDLHGEKAEWVRLRDNGNKITMTYKKRDSLSIDAAEEIEILVDDFDRSYELLSRLSWNGVFYQENKRKIFKLESIEFMIDSWPKIPVYLEIESNNEENVKKGAELLGLDFDDGKNLTGSMIYEKYGIDIHDYNELKF